MTYLNKVDSSAEVEIHMEYEIRPVRSGDGEGINALRRMPGVFENTLGIPSERICKSESFINNPDANSHQFVAVLKTESGQELIIGMAGLNVFSSPRLRHSGSIGMMVHRDYQGMGIGSRLIETVLDVADNWLMLIRVQLEVYTDNEHAIALYKKHGFEVEGTKRKATIKNGKLVDEYLMARINDYGGTV